MKKNYFLTLLLLFMVSVSFGQVIVAEGFSYADGSLVPNGGWAREGGTAGDFKVSAGKAVIEHGAPSEDVKLAFTPVAGSIYAGFDFSVDDLGAPYNGSDNEYFVHFDFKARIDIVPPTGSGDFTIGVASASSSADAIWGTDLTFGTTYRAIVEFNQDTGTAQLWVSPTNKTDTSILGVGTSAFSVGEFEFRQSDSSENETVRVDNLMIGQTFNDVLTFVANTTPSLSIGGITNNQVFSPETTEAPVTLNISNFTISGDNGSGMSDNSGDGFLKTTLEETGEPTDVTNFFTSNPGAITVVAGRTYNLTVELVDNNGNSLSPKVEQMITFSVATYTDVANLGALRAGTEGNYFNLVGEVIYTFEGTIRNQKYIQDNTAAILIDDTAGRITTAYNVGDGITGIRGQLGSFRGVLQFVPQKDSGAATSSGNAIPSQVVSIADLNANFDNYESEFITINDVNFTDADGTAEFSNGSNYNITDGTNTSEFRVQFNTSGIDGTVIPSSSANITGIAAENNGTAQIFGVSLANIVLGIVKNNIDGFATYPNPVTNKNFTITSSSVDQKEVSIFNVLGKRVLTTNVSGTKSNVDVSSISSGLYIMKVTEGTKTATTKLIIK